MKRSVLGAAMFAALGVFIACNNSNDEGPDNNDALKSVKMVVGTSSKAIGEPVGNTDGKTGEKLSFNNGYVYFTAPGGIITEAYQIVPDGTSIEEGEKKVIIKEGNSYLFKGLHGSTRKVYIVANAGTGLPVSGNISGIVDNGDRVVQVKDLNKSDGEDEGVVHARIYGQVDLAPYSGSEENAPDYTAAITPMPTSSRLEIKQITADNDKYPSSSLIITGYRIDGIFINNYFGKLKLSGTYSDGYLVSNGTEEEKYTGSYYDPAGVVHDYDGSAGLGQKDAVNGLKYYAGAEVEGKRPVWAYNLLAPAGTATADHFPHIIIRLADVMVKDGAAGTPKNEGQKFLTISSFKNGTGESAEAVTFRQGKIYYIDDIVFAAEDLHLKPYEKPIDAQVNITIYEWERETIHPSIK